MNGHIDADGLAEYRVGLITGRREREIATHLATCPKCASVGDRLAEVSLLLAAAPAPAIPDVVAARLQAALDAETPIPSERPISSERLISSEHTVVTRARARFKLPRVAPLRVLAPAAAVVVLAAGAFGLSQLSGGSATSGPADSSGVGGPAAAGPPPGGGARV